jgi:HPt (histidine-containing phosphotransfer) domain-containing protein
MPGDASCHSIQTLFWTLGKSDPMSTDRSLRGQSLEPPLTSMNVELDIERALRRMDGDRELLIHLIDLIVQDSPGYVEHIKTALEAGRLSEVQNSAHALRGLVSNVDCSVVEQQALEIESLALAGNREPIASSLKRLAQLLQSMIAKLTDVHRELSKA